MISYDTNPIIIANMEYKWKIIYPILSIATKYIIDINNIKKNDKIIWYPFLYFFIIGYNTSKIMENKKPYIKEKVNSFICKDNSII